MILLRVLRLPVDLRRGALIMTSSTSLFIRKAGAYLTAFIVVMLLSDVSDAQDWKMQSLQIPTRWAASVSPANALRP